MNGVRFDWVINFGTLLHLVGIVVALAAFLWRSRELTVRLHNEAMTMMRQLHQENVVRLIKLEEKVIPIWRRFIDDRGDDGS